MDTASQIAHAAYESLGAEAITELEPSERFLALLQAVDVSDATADLEAGVIRSCRQLAGLA